MIFRRKPQPIQTELPKKPAEEHWMHAPELPEGYNVSVRTRAWYEANYDLLGFLNSVLCFLRQDLIIEELNAKRAEIAKALMSKAKEIKIIDECETYCFDIVCSHPDVKEWPHVVCRHLLTLEEINRKG